MTYEIRAGKNAPCELVSVVPAKFWSGDVVNFVCEGTHTYCKGIKDRLEGSK